MQDESGRLFLFEQPNTATSWNIPEVMELSKQPGVIRVTADMCAFKLSVNGNGIDQFNKKPTGLLTNSMAISKALSKGCPGTHSHIHLERKQNTTESAKYTKEFCDTILRGLKNALNERNLVVSESFKRRMSVAKQ